jgi:hypothetical protein
MDALDLTLGPPRSPSYELGGLVMLARTIDKMRASLPGGKLGDYRIAGFSGRLIEALELDEAEMLRCVAEAQSDDDIVAWVLERTTPEQRDRYNSDSLSRRIADRADDPEFFERYPNARTLPLSTRLLDMLEHDDRASFAKLDATPG